MTQNEFNVVLEQQYRKCADVLVHKKKEYTGDRIDRLSAFKIAASLQGCTPKTALAGMMSKHVVSLYDMCYSSLLQFELEQWDEKITDCINYLILLKALIKPIGLWGQRHKQYLKEHKQFLYTTMLIEGTLNSYLADIDRQAQERLLLLTKQIAEQENVTEKLKADNAMLWVQKMNEIQSRVREIIYSEIIYA